MIVADTNVIAYCWIRGDRTALAQRVRLQDRDWHVPILWRSELRNVLAQHVRRGTLALEDASAVMVATESALAKALGVHLVTEDRALLKSFPDFAVSMEACLVDATTPPKAHSPRARYAVSRRRVPHAGSRARA